MVTRRTNTQLFSDVNPTEIQIVWGAGGAPRGLQVHKKTLHHRDRDRTRTRHQKKKASINKRRRQNPKRQEGAGQEPGTTLRRSWTRTRNHHRAIYTGQCQGKKPDKQALGHQNRSEDQENLSQGQHNWHSARWRRVQPAQRTPAR